MDDYAVLSSSMKPVLHSEYEPADIHGDQSWLPLNRWDDRLWDKANKPHPMDMHSA